jgi:hypothetical protein
MNPALRFISSRSFLGLFSLFGLLCSLAVFVLIGLRWLFSAFFGSSPVAVPDALGLSGREFSFFLFGFNKLDPVQTP